MRRTLVSAAMGCALAVAAFWAFDVYQGVRQATEIAELQAVAADEWLGLSDVSIADGSAGVEPIATWTVEPKRVLEMRIAVNTRDVATGDAVCIGGTVTFILEPSWPHTYSRPLSRIAGVDHCEWPPGVYRSRFTWTLTDPESRVTKALFQESDQFAVVQ
ncbi:MAG: hypothetical protein ACOH2L_16580 [Devosia sp.]